MTESCHDKQAGAKLCLSLSPSLCLSPPLSVSLPFSLSLSVSLPFSLSLSLSLSLFLSVSLSLSGSLALFLPLSVLNNKQLKWCDPSVPGPHQSETANCVCSPRTPLDRADACQQEGFKLAVLHKLSWEDYDTMVM